MGSVIGKRIDRFPAHAVAGNAPCRKAAGWHMWIAAGAEAPDSWTIMSGLPVVIAVARGRPVLKSFGSDAAVVTESSKVRAGIVMGAAHTCVRSVRVMQVFSEHAGGAMATDISMYTMNEWRKLTAFG